MSGSSDTQKFSSSFRWNLKHRRTDIPTAAEKRRSRISLGLLGSIVAAIGLGAMLVELEVPIAELIALVGIAVLVTIWIYIEIVVGVLGLFRSGWRLDDDKLVVREATSKRSFQRAEIRSVHELICPQGLVWTGVATNDAEDPYVARGIPATEIPKIRKLLGLAEARSSIEAAPSPFRLFLSRLRKPSTEGEPLVSPSQPNFRIDLTPDVVGLVWALKLVSFLADRRGSGEARPARAIGMFVNQIEHIGRLSDAEQLLDLLFESLGSLHKSSGFEIEMLPASMGEHPPNALTDLGGITMELLRSQARLGGTEDPAVRERFEELAAGDPALRAKVLAWACLAVTRLASEGEIPRFAELLAPTPVDSRGKIANDSSLVLRVAGPDKRRAQKFSSSIRWNLTHPQTLAPSAAQRRRNRIFLGSLAIGVLTGYLGESAPEDQLTIRDLLETVGGGVLGILAIWACGAVVAGSLGPFRPGWLFEDDWLVVRGAVFRTPFQRDEIRSVHQIASRRNLAWTAITTLHSEDPFIARGIPITEIPRIREQLGLVDEPSNEAGPSSIFALRRPRNEGEELVRRAVEDSKMYIPTETVGMVRGFKLASLLPEASDFGEACPTRTIDKVGNQIDHIEGLPGAARILDRLLTHLVVLQESSGFESERLEVAMGEHAANNLSYLGGLTMELLRSQPGLGGAGDPTVRERFEELAAGDANLHAKVLAWACLAVARLANAGEIQRLEDWPAFSVI